VAGELVLPTLPLVRSSLSAQSGLFLHCVMLVAFVLYGMTLSLNHVTYLSFRKCFCFLKVKFLAVLGYFMFFNSDTL
jgi:hypothetical protein